ncbi:MAG: twin-arginine translocation signal domain-containing protein [Anaerolineae bacterium]|nr:twin-arginine translocation signal domain-containing protein [Anaerolineae bacterium]
MRTNKLSRRDFLRMSALTAAGAALAGCCPTPPPAVEPTKQEVQPTVKPAEPEGQVIQYWFSWGNFLPIWEEGLMQTDEFKEALGPDTLELKPIPGAPETLLTAVAAGTPPDGASNVQYLDYMARDVLLPIDDMVATSSVVKKEVYLEGTWNDAFYQGTMYGVPADEGFVRYGLNYNTRMVEDAGLDPDSPPVTWEDCLVWHEALTKFDAAGNLIQIGLDPYDAMGGQIGIQDGFYPPVSWGWKWFDAETGAFDLDNDMMVESLDVMGEFYKIAGPDNMAGMRQIEGQGGWGGSFNAEVQAMIIEGYWHPGETVIQKPEVAEYNRATWAPVPDNRKGVKVQGTGGHYVIFFKDGKNPEGMFRIAEFLNTDVACDLIFTGVGWLPGLKPYLETVDPAAYPGLDFYFDSVTDADEWSSPARCPITSFVGNQYSELREKVFRDEMTAADAAAEFQARCEAEWAAQGF